MKDTKYRGLVYEGRLGLFMDLIVKRPPPRTRDEAQPKTEVLVDAGLITELSEGAYDLYQQVVNDGDGDSYTILETL